MSACRGHMYTHVFYTTMARGIHVYICIQTYIGWVGVAANDIYTCGLQGTAVKVRLVRRVGRTWLGLRLELGLGLA